MHPLIASLRGRLIVSCQAYPGEPMRCPETMAQIALAAERGGPPPIRCQGLADIAAVKGRSKCRHRPMERGTRRRLHHAHAAPRQSVLNAGADVVARRRDGAPAARRRDFRRNREGVEVRGRPGHGGLRLHRRRKTGRRSGMRDPVDDARGLHGPAPSHRRARRRALELMVAEFQNFRSYARAESTPPNTPRRDGSGRVGGGGRNGRHAPDDDNRMVR